MRWYLIVILTVVGVHAVNFLLDIIADIFNIDEIELIPFKSLTVFISVCILLYPLYAVCKYKRSCGFYKKHGISMLAFLFGKRPKR